MHNINVFPFIKPAYIVSFPYFPFMKNEVNGTGMVYYVQPIAYVFAFAIHRKWFIIFDIVNTKRKQFFWKLVRAVIVRAITYNIR